MGSHNYFQSMPEIKTVIPGPISVKLYNEEQKLYAKGNSAASIWSQLSIVEGKGCIVKDADGNYFLDGCSGTVVMNIGHNNSDVNNAIKSQIEKLIHFYDFTSETRVKFLKKLKSTLFNGCDIFHINNSGTEAVESAIRMIRSSTGRFEIISFENSYHGRTLGALSLTSGSPKKGIGPLLPGVYHSKKNFNYFIDLIENTLYDKPAAVIIEPMQGAGGMYPMEYNFLKDVREYCFKNEICLIFDEILTGIGRTGKMWCYQHYNIYPDVILFGKGIASGIPIGIVAGKKNFLNFGPISENTKNGSTFGGNQIACVAGHETLKVLQKNNIVKNSKEKGEYLKNKLINLVNKFDFVSDVRGLGLAIGIELCASTKIVINNNNLCILYKIILSNGLIISSTSNILRITPPLIINYEQCDKIFSIILTSFEQFSEKMKGGSM